MAIVDSDALNTALKEANGNVDAAVELFNQSRHSEVRATQRLIMVP